LPAATYGDPYQIVKLFLEKKADITNFRAVRKEALLTAMYWGRTDAARLLFDPGVDVDDSKFGSCGYMLETVAAWSNGQFVQLVLDAKPGVNAVGGYYGTVLMAAALQGHEEAVRLLLDHGANIHAS
jgi:ankyrin repeat protein